MARWIVHVTAGLLLITLTGCVMDRHPSTPVTDENKANKVLAIGAATGAFAGALGAGPIPFTTVLGGVMGGALGQYLEKDRPLLEKLHANRVLLVQQGQRYRFVLSADDFFFTQSPRMNIAFEPVLDMIAQVIKDIPSVGVEVAGYTDDLGSKQKKFALTQMRARHVANYLWEQGVDTRVLSAVGYGDANPVARNDNNKSRKMNRRIEINLQSLPA